MNEPIPADIPVKSVLILIGVLVALSGCAWWASKGAHRGWTKTTVAVHKVDEITEIPYVEYEKRLVPGVEFPLVSVAFGGMLIGCGLWKGRARGHARKAR